jgi:hypothetical protein
MKFACVLLLFATAATDPHPLTPGQQFIADHITEDDLRGNLSFLASDALEGRSTPSRGQELAAEFIASQFRRAHLEAPVNGSYFQDAGFAQFTADPDKVELSFASRKGQFVVPPADVSLAVYGGVAIDHASLVLVKKDEEQTADIAGKAVFVDHPIPPALREQMLARGPALMILQPGAVRRLATRFASEEQAVSSAPVLALDAETSKRLSAEYAPDETVTLRAPAATVVKVTVRNVVGVLPGSDPELKNQYVLVTAHYDHLAMKSEGADRIYNGANDDGSGTVSVIEIAQALAAMPVHPRRSIVFIAFFGEELGLLGSRYYGRHPLFPLANTVAQINIEQVGRTNAKDGFDPNGITFTGYAFTDLPAAFAQEGTGIKVYSTKDSDAFFGRSDNQALADVGIPASTVSAAYIYADYHQVSDEWQKIEFDNMARVDRAIALGIDLLADRDQVPRWDRTNHGAERYWKAYDRLHPEMKH